MIRALIIAFSSGAAAGLLTIALGRIIAYVYPSEGVWTFVAVVAGLAAAVGIGVAERSRTNDPILSLRRLAGVLLLGGVASALVLLALYSLPMFRPTIFAMEVEVIGPVVGLLFFPMLLIAMGPRMVLNSSATHTGLITGAAIIGVIVGWALVRTPEALLTPTWAIAASGILLHGAGVVSAWSGELAVRRCSYVGLLAGATIFVSSLLAFRMNSELYFVIGSV